MGTSQSKQEQNKEEIIIAQAGNSGGQTSGILQSVSRQEYLSLAIIILILLGYTLYFYEKLQYRWRKKIKQAVTRSSEKLDA